MDAPLGAQPAVGAAAVDRDRDALEAGLLALGLVDDLGPEAVALRPAEVHPEEHLGPVGRLGAAGAGADREERAAARRTRRRRGGRSARAAKSRSRAVAVAVELRRQLGVAGLRRRARGVARRSSPRRSRSRHSSISVRRPSASRRTFWAARWSSQKPGSLRQRLELGERALPCAARSKTPRGRPDPLDEVADGGRVHLVPDLGDPGAGSGGARSAAGPSCSGRRRGSRRGSSVVGADAAVAVAVERGGVAAGPAVALAGDEIDERGFLGLLHESLSLLGRLAGRRAVSRDGIAGRSPCVRGGCREYTWGNPHSQEGETGRPGRFSVATRVRRPPLVRRAERPPGSPATARRPTRKYKASAPSSWTVARSRSAALASLGLVRVGEPYASMPWSSAIRRTRSMWVRSDTKTALRRSAVAEDRRRRPPGDSSVVRPWSSTRIASPARPATIAYARGRPGLRRAVARQLAAGHDEDGARPASIEVDGVVEAGREDRRRAAVVLGGAEDDDRVGRPALVARRPGAQIRHVA